MRILIVEDEPSAGANILYSLESEGFAPCVCTTGAEAIARAKAEDLTLVVLDVVPVSGSPSYEQRRALLESLIQTDAVFSGDASRPVPCGAVMLPPTLRAVSQADALAFYQRLRAANRALGCDFFEGVVMKRADSIYPVQMRSATEEFCGWVKHRFLT